MAEKTTKLEIARRLGYWYAHLALISGIILIAAGIRQLLEGHSGMGYSRAA